MPDAAALARLADAACAHAHAPYSKFHAGGDDFRHENENTCMPCGECRQVMMEFMQPDAPLRIDGIGSRPLSDLVPRPFKL